MSTDLSSKRPDINGTDRPLISVIIPHYQQADSLALCLESLEAQTLCRTKFEIIVVDNKSACDLSEVRVRFPSVKLLVEAKKGAAHARNRGLEVARGKLIAFTDADCVADAHWLEQGLIALKNADLVGGAISVTIKNEDVITPVEAFERIFAFRQQSYIERKHFAVTANLLATRNAAEAVGPFRNGLAEDADWCWRARTLGFRLVFNDTSIISHPARRSWEDLTRKWDRLVCERWYGFEGQRPERRALWIILAGATALSWLPHLMSVAFSRRICGMDARLASAGVLVRIRLWRACRMLTVMHSHDSPSLSECVEL